MDDPLITNTEGFAIPSWDELHRQYEEKWLEEREKFFSQLKENFRGLVSQFKSGKQEIFELSESQVTHHYEKAFRELFADTGYQATVGEVERIGTGNKKIKKTIYYIT